MNRKRSASCGEDRPNKIQESENENIQNTEVSSFRIIASQLVAIFPIIFLKIRFGMSLGFTTALIPKLSKKNAGIDFTLDELTWFSSYFFVGPIAAMSGGFVAQCAGVRRLSIFSFLLFISADLLFHWADSATMILVAQAIVGFTAGLSKGSCFTYTAEIIQPKFRSMIMAVMNGTVLSARFFGILLGNLMYWRSQVFVSLVFSVMGFACIHFIPESPQWLANKNRFESAGKSLARLRGWTTSEAVKAELYSSIMNATDSLSSMETTAQNDLNSRKQTKLKKTLSLYLDRSFYIPLLTVTSVFFFAEFNGTHGLLIFSGLIFDEIKSPIDGQVASIIMSALTIVGAFIYILSVRFLGKRKLTLASLVIITVCLAVVLTLLYLMNNNIIASDIYSWIISLALITSTFANNIGIGKVAYFINSELFPQKLRYVGCGIGFFLDEIMVAILGKIFLYIVKAITFPGALTVFTMLNIIGFVIIYFILPETEGVTLQQIEEQYAGTRNLKNKDCHS